MTTQSLQNTPTGRCLAASGWMVLLQGSLDWARLLMANAARPACCCQGMAACREQTPVSGRETHLGSMQSSSAALQSLLSKPSHAQHTVEQAVALVCAVYLCPHALRVKQCVVVAPVGRSSRAICSCCIPCTGGVPCNGASTQPHNFALCNRGARHRRGQTAQAS